MPTGPEILRLAESRLGEKYLNVLVPKDNPQWHGPWDCAEFASWVVYQVTGQLYGCTDNTAPPAAAEAYSGAWSRDAARGVLRNVTRADANVLAGAFLIRKPPMPGKMGHVAISNGEGKVIEAAGMGLGVRRGSIEGRLWHHCSLIPGVEYAVTGVPVAPKPLPHLLQLDDPRMEGPLVRKVQLALKAAGFSPGPVDRQYGPNTVAAVYAFQKSNRLIGDGIVGPMTAKKLGLEWPT
jgi:N-acetylmuramoyl-L-alanine amidase